MRVHMLVAMLIHISARLDPEMFQHYVSLFTIPTRCKFPRPGPRQDVVTHSPSCYHTWRGIDEIVDGNEICVYYFIFLLY